MNIKELLLEYSNSKPIIVVDVQPEYDDYCGKILNSLKQIINNSKGPILWFFNGDEYANDTTASVMEYIEDNGIYNNNIRLVQKGFGFFRDWIDSSKITDKDIIITVRYMIQNKLRQSDEIKDDILYRLIDKYQHEMPGTIYVPEINIAEIHKLSGCYICGGYKTECFKEITLLLNIFNIKYKIIKSLVY